MEKILEMKHEKLELIKEQRGLLDKIDEEGRKFNYKEKAQYKDLEGRIDKLDEGILTAEANLEERRKLAEREACI